jgi:hypothetical protein
MSPETNLLLGVLSLTDESLYWHRFMASQDHAWVPLGLRYLFRSATQAEADDQPEQHMTGTISIGHKLRSRVVLASHAVSHPENRSQAKRSSDPSLFSARSRTCISMGVRPKNAFPLHLIYMR